jgi:integrase
MQRNPMELVTVKGASKRMSKPHSMTVEEFQKFIEHLREPFRAVALMCVCRGLRISECLALRWSDIDWLNGKLTVKRGMVRQHVDDVKTETSQRRMSLDAGLLEILKAWKQTTQFSAQEDWVFASPAVGPRLPWSYPQILRLFDKMASDAGIAHVSTHTMRHTHYGDVVTDEMALASGRVAGLALNRAQG